MSALPSGPITQAQLTAAGYVVVEGAGSRFQIWAGTRPDLTAAMLAWDSVSGRRKFVADVNLHVVLTILGIAAVVSDLISAIPNATVSSATKAALRGDLLAALMDD